jgi:hypothetical protein
MIRPVIAVDLAQAIGDLPACELRARCFDVEPRGVAVLSYGRQPLLCVEWLENAGRRLVIGAQLRNRDPEEWDLAERR